jgi:hypothetical protein
VQLTSISPFFVFCLTTGPASDTRTRELAGHASGGRGRRRTLRVRTRRRPSCDARNGSYRRAPFAHLGLRLMRVTVACYGLAVRDRMLWISRVLYQSSCSSIWAGCRLLFKHFC